MLTRKPASYDLFVEIKTGNLFRGHDEDDTKGFIKIQSHHIFEPFTTLLLPTFCSLPRLCDIKDTGKSEWTVCKMIEMTGNLSSGDMKQFRDYLSVLLEEWEK